MRARLSLSLLLLALPATGATQTWQKGYEASFGSLPSAQGWTLVTSDPLPDDGLNEGNYLVALGALTQGNTGGPSGQAANSQFYSLPVPRVDLDDDVIVIDARVKILSSTSSPGGTAFPRAGFGISLTDEHSDQVALHIGSGRLYLRGGNDASNEQFFDSTADFADYQLRIDRRGVRLLVNGGLLETLDRSTAWRAGVSTERLLFGDLSDEHSSHSQVQHVRIARFGPPSADVRNYRVVAALSAFDSSARKSLAVSCPPGTKTLTGGVTTLGADGSVGISDSLPGPMGSLTTSWYGAARELVDTGASWQIRVDAICGEIAGHTVSATDAAVSTAPDQSGSALCPSTKNAFSGGAGIVGAELRQALTDNSLSGGVLPSDPTGWGSNARDSGAGATSNAAWGLRTAAICSDAPRFERVTGSSNLDGSPLKGATANCPGGKVPIGGTATIVGNQGVDAALRYSRPKESSTPGAPFVGWEAQAQAASGVWYLTVSVICAPRTDPAFSNNGLIGRWAGEFDATDSWGIRHGTLENDVGFDPGFFGQGFLFARPLPEILAKPWVRIPNRAPSGPSSEFPAPGATEAARLDLYPDDSFTADAWIQTDSLVPEDYSTVLQLYDAGGTEPNPNCSFWQLLLTSDGQAYGSARPAVLGPCVAGITSGGANLADGRRHHLALRRDSDIRRLSLWVDGARVSETSLSISGSDGPLQPSSGNGDPLSIGVSRGNGSTALVRPFDGLIDDVKYYDRALADEEIQETAGCGVPIVPRVINLDAARFGQPSLGPAGLCVFLEEGRYRLTLVNPSMTSAARFTAWSPSPAHPWMTLYSVRGEVDPGLLGGFPTGSDSPQQAFDATVERQVTWTLNADQRVYFSLINEFALDNRGGVSIRIEAAPPDSDGDAVEDPDDNCPAWPNASQSDVDQNGIGDACECGDQNGDGRVNVLDLVAINLAIFNPSQVTPLCDTNEDGLCNVLDIIGANLKIFGQPAYCSRYPAP